MGKRRGWADYHGRLARVMAHVHDHLAEPLDLDRLADLAHLSPWHWHRIWHAMYGETLADTVRRLRMHRASGLLAHSTLPVADVARRCGYPNAQSFARAFRDHHGLLPTAYRRAGSHRQFDDSRPPAPPGGAAWDVQIRNEPRVRLAGLDHRGSYMDIGRAFETAFVHMHAAGLVTPHTRWLAVYFDDPFAVPAAQLASRAGLSLPPGSVAPAGLVEFELGGTRCAVLRHRGPYADMRSAYRWLYGRWLPATGHELADQPVFEVYLNNPRDTAPADLLTDICLPLA